MNAVERVRDKYKENHTRSIMSEYTIGYLKALDNVQEELSKEISCNYESENTRLQCEISELQRHISELTNDIKSIERVKEIMQAQLDIVKMIFGGK